MRFPSLARLPPHLARLGLGLLALAACDKIRALPGVEPKSRALVSAEPSIALGPWLLEPAATQMTVAWVTSAPSPGRVWYGTAEPDRLAQEGGVPAIDHRVVIGSLKPGTRYHFRVEGAVPADGSFSTAPLPDQPFDVLVYGDNRTNSGDHALVVRAAAAERTQLALHTGDMVVNASDERLWKTWFAEERDLLSTTPLVPTVGNHEITDQGVAYTRWFQRKELPPYRSIDYGPLHIVVLDSFEMAAGATPRLGGISEAQRAWLEEDLRSVGKDRHVWVLVHQGPYAHPMHMRPGHGGSEAVKQALAAAAKIHPLEVVFAGHEHFYERGEIDGLRYFVFGGGGAPLEEPDPTFPGVQIAQKALSYAVVQVCGCHVAGKVKDIAAHVIDSFRLADCDTPCGPFAGNPAAVSRVSAPASNRTAVARVAPEAASSAEDEADGGANGSKHRRRRHRRPRQDRAGGAAAKSATDAGVPGP